MNNTSPKYYTRNELANVVAERQQEGECGVFTNGCFDLLHLGHVRYLQEARTYGDFLVLGLNSDASTCRLKGPGRPYVPELERAEILAALSCIDYVTIFDEPTASLLVALLRPSVYIKGGDYASTQDGTPDMSRLPEARVVQEYGGRVQLIPYLPGHSTTALIAKIRGE